MKTSTPHILILQLILLITDYNQSINMQIIHESFTKVYITTIMIVNFSNVGGGLLQNACFHSA